MLDECKKNLKFFGPILIGFRIVVIIEGFADCGEGGEMEKVLPGSLRIYSR